MISSGVNPSANASRIAVACNYSPGDSGCPRSGRVTGRQSRSNEPVVDFSDYMLFVMRHSTVGLSRSGRDVEKNLVAVTSACS